MNALRFSPELIQKYAHQINEVYMIICTAEVISSLIQITRLEYQFKIQNPISRSFKYSAVSFKRALNEYSIF